MADFRPLKATLSGDQSRVMMKLVVDSITGRILGCHIVGPEARNRGFYAIDAVADAYRHEVCAARSHEAGSRSLYPSLAVRHLNIGDPSCTLGTPRTRRLNAGKSKRQVGSAVMG